jgi:hypothetical protein
MNTKLRKNICKKGIKLRTKMITKFTTCIYVMNVLSTYIQFFLCRNKFICWCAETELALYIGPEYVSHGEGIEFSLRNVILNKIQNDI